MFRAALTSAYDSVTAPSRYFPFFFGAGLAGDFLGYPYPAIMSPLSVQAFSCCLILKCSIRWHSRHSHITSSGRE